jgi:hypothetical protein
MGWVRRKRFVERAGRSISVVGAERTARLDLPAGIVRGV